MGPAKETRDQYLQTGTRTFWLCRSSQISIRIVTQSVEAFLKAIDPCTAASSMLETQSQTVVTHEQHLSGHGSRVSARCRCARAGGAGRSEGSRAGCSGLPGPQPSS